MSTLASAGTRFASGCGGGTSVSDAKLRAAVTVPSLARIQGSGSSRIRLQDPLAGDDLHVELSGASNAEVLVRRTISASLSGASSLRYRGAPTLTRQETSGGSSISQVR
jgi:Putative auto-transporter adhesin, head GIN domain